MNSVDEIESTDDCKKDVTENAKISSPVESSVEKLQTTKLTSAFSICDILSKQDQPKMDAKKQQQQLFTTAMAANFGGLVVPSGPYWYPWLPLCQLDPNAMKQKSGKDVFNKKKKIQFLYSLYSFLMCRFYLRAYCIALFSFCKFFCKQH